MEVEQGNGNFVKECSEECLPSAYPGPPGSTVTNCTPCPYEGQVYNYLTVPPSCECDVNKGYVRAADRCVPETFTEQFTVSTSPFSESFANQVSYSAIETQTGDGTWSLSTFAHQSGTLQYYYMDAAVGCTTFKDVKKCQLLANLCVLQVYNEDAVVCKLYKDALSKQNDGIAYEEYYNN